MRILTSIAIALISTTSLLALHGHPKESTPILVANPNNTSFIIHDIFFSDYDNAILFIDFEALPDQIISINILRDKTPLMEDEVTDLPFNTIYEINLDIIREGTYTVEVVTAEGIVIHKNIWVE